MQKIYTLLAVIIVLLIIIITQSLMLDMSDEKVIQMSEKFCKQLNIDIDSNPRVSRKLFERIKRVMYGKYDLEISIDIDYVNKEVVSFDNHKLRDQVFSKYKIPIDNRKTRNWPTLLTESKAKEIAYLYANKIGLPQDVVFSHMSLDKTYNGTWNAHWKRIHNGYPYEDGSLLISIMAIDGEFYSYGKFFRGKPCPTDVKITKEKAIEVGRNRILRLLSDAKAKKHLQDYVVISSELKIVQPNAIFGFLTPYHRSNSRLAWVVTYSLPSEDLRLAEYVNFVDKFIIKIDAASGNVVGGSFTR